MNDELLAKTNRMNLLFDFYELLLTEKQRTFLSYYVHDDYSLGEIAENVGISRQAVYEHIKRAESMLQEYEAKLGLLQKFEQRQKLMRELDEVIVSLDDDYQTKVRLLIEQIERID
ncbi:putative DNA-binding protein [Paenibacillus sp. N1-5-1-14]|uniref:putative DNA-binding protein n=1 Tax=Paenibacillus radicibacter TaxID=2972488 RepID=UPI002158A6B4|nr:putative DNA-binding protein [Paenibacillus radicibacter]MCR8641778.1 putative DNA-binding protein [Paenibacillus radicibacter]